MTATITHRGEHLKTIRDHAEAWSTRWGVELEVLRRILPPAARLWAGEPLASFSSTREAWGSLSDDALRYMAGQLALAVRNDWHRDDARERLVGWARDAEAALTVAELAPLNSQMEPAWAATTEPELAAHAAELRRRRAAAPAPSPAPVQVAATAGPDLGARGRSGSRCASCGAEIRWVVSATTSKRHPLDPPRLFVVPSADGAVTLVTDDGSVVRGRASGPGHGAVGGHVSHFATCPAAGQHRRRATAARP